MGTIPIHKKNDHPPHEPEIAHEPKRMRPLERLLSFDPFERLWSHSETVGSFKPPLEIKETKDACVFHADLPGVHETDIDITISGNQMRILGRRVDRDFAHGDHIYSRECLYGEFARTFSLPDTLDLDNVFAHLRDGVLTISIKKKTSVETKKIPIGIAEKKDAE
jgi:HSP20 family protein